MAIMAFAVLLFSLVLPYVYLTAGEPRRRAVEELAKSKSQQDIPDAWRRGNDDDFSWGDEGDEGAEGVKPVFLGEKNRQKDDDEDNERPLPNWFLPDAGAAASLFGLITGTILFNLLCRWFVWFKTACYFEPSSTVEEKCFIHIVPYAHRGREELVQVKKDQHDLYFEFQRQKFKIDKTLSLDMVKLLGLDNNLKNEKVDIEEEELAIAALSPSQLESCNKLTRDKIKTLGAASPILARTDLPMAHYVTNVRAIQTKDVEELRRRYGPNSLSVDEKTVVELIQEGLLSPLAMFQFFTTGLYLMDEYWQYSIFNLITILMMEGMTAFQRLRTMKSLKDLTPKPFEVPVFRQDKWVMLKTTELLPGDLISLSPLAHSTSPAPGSLSSASAAKRGNDAIPCDCLILHGSAVVNEATLTGESVPQMKDALKMSSHADMQAPLDISGRDRVNVLFSGTCLVSAMPGEESKAQHQTFPRTPDGGCLCYVLRTGFGSSQGELMQMIEFSTENVSSDSRETGIALLILFCFALCSAGYVFKAGLEKGERTTHELLLRCTMILTSVVPRQLPIQMAVAVNHALLTLNKQGIFCTEPYRVPYSGKITHCLFDKTGTLTTDELVPVVGIEILSIEYPWIDR